MRSRPERAASAQPNSAASSAALRVLPARLLLWPPPSTLPPRVLLRSLASAPAPRLPLARPASALPPPRASQWSNSTSINAGYRRTSRCMPPLPAAVVVAAAGGGSSKATADGCRRCMSAATAAACSGAKCATPSTCTHTPFGATSGRDAHASSQSNAEPRRSCCTSVGTLHGAAPAAPMAAAAVAAVCGGALLRRPAGLPL
eukprot:264770-Chlamydomonas_euryale.AAC.6